MPTATAPRKRRTRKASTTVKQPRKSASKVTPEVKEVKKVRRNLTQLNGFELAILPLLYLEGFAKLVLKIV
tara:strand:+ start:117 stop:329 length:213 start_codon:yes stop_codon:yes gene_type:complete